MIPIPHQMAYAIPIGIVLTARERKYIANPNPTREINVGIGFVNPTEAFKKEVEATSQQIAISKNI